MPQRSTIQDRIKVANKRLVKALKKLDVHTADFPEPKDSLSVLNLTERLADAIERLANITPDTEAQDDSDFGSITDIFAQNEEQ